MMTYDVKHGGLKIARNAQKAKRYFHTLKVLQRGVKRL